MNRTGRALPLVVLVGALALGACSTLNPFAHSQRPDAPSESRLERIAVARDGRGFVQIPSGKSFHPWGLNYGNHGRLLEDFWEKEWQTVADDFQEMKTLGANVARVHLQFGKFMTSADMPNPGSLERLSRLLALAEQTGIYLDLTGLACYRPSDTPKWYDDLGEADRWTVQARFWEAVAATCAPSPAVFCYDLINEPVSPAEKRKPGGWYSGALFGGYDFLQWIALDPAGRAREEIAQEWIRRLTTAIRKHDREHLITVGMLSELPHEANYSGFDPRQAAPDLDFLSVHIYPKSGKVEEALASLRGFAVGKPVVIEETFPLACGRGELEMFLRASRPVACGWMGHYDGQTPQELNQIKQSGQMTFAQAFWLDWLESFQALKPEFAGP